MLRHQFTSWLQISAVELLTQIRRKKVFFFFLARAYLSQTALESIKADENMTDYRDCFTTNLILQL